MSLERLERSSRFLIMRLHKDINKDCFTLLMGYASPRRLKPLLSSALKDRKLEVLLRCVDVCALYVDVKLENN